MSDIGLQAVEAGMRFARARAAVLASDVANAHTPGFIPRDVEPILERVGSGMRFAAALEDVGAGGTGALEYSMGATAANSVTYRALADEERAMLREFRTVAEEARR